MKKHLESDMSMNKKIDKEKINVVCKKFINFVHKYPDIIAKYNPFDEIKIEEGGDCNDNR